MFKRYIQKKLEKYVRQYFAKHPDIKLVAVAGSVGKTSTKIAIATVLSEKFRVRVHGGNHNSELSAPLAVLGIAFPEDIRSISGWLAIFKEAKKRVKEPTNVDVIVQELGTDRIGQIAGFGKYLKPDIAVVTAVSPEHMEFFKTMDNVAREEMAVINYSKEAIVNCDDVSNDYFKYASNKNIHTYGTGDGAEYHFVNKSYSFKDGFTSVFVAPELDRPIDATVNLIGEHTIRSAVAAAAVATKLGMDADGIVRGLARVKPVPGRMNILRGVNNSVIIDDTYNSSPLAVESSLNTIYKLPVLNRIVVLGSMNELGKISAKEHEVIGKMCDPNKLDWVVTVGDDAGKYLAPAAKSNGCQVKVCTNALEAGAFVNSVIKSGTVALFKGSEGKIYLEEAVKVVLHNTSDEAYLVRQSPKWLELKNKFFSKFS